MGNGFYAVYMGLFAIVFLINDIILGGTALILGGTALGDCGIIMRVITSIGAIISILMTVFCLFACGCYAYMAIVGY